MKPNKNNRMKLTFDAFWEEVRDIQYDEAAIVEAIYICAVRDSRTLPVGCSNDCFRRAVYHLPGFSLAATAGSYWLLWYLKVLCKAYCPNYSHQSFETDHLAQIMADRWYASQNVELHKLTLDADLIEELMKWLINDVRPYSDGDEGCFPISWADDVRARVCVAKRFSLLDANLHSDN
jgi:hypothetical protein